jgi:hypothetical protein
MVMKSREVIEAVRAELAQYGVHHVELVGGGKHHRLIWQYGGREFWVPAPRGSRNSPSAGKNARKQIRKILEAQTSGAKL